MYADVDKLRSQTPLFHYALHRIEGGGLEGPSCLFSSSTGCWADLGRPKVVASKRKGRKDSAHHFRTFQSLSCGYPKAIMLNLFVGSISGNFTCFSLPNPVGCSSFLVGEALLSNILLAIRLPCQARQGEKLPGGVPGALPWKNIRSQFSHVEQHKSEPAP